MYSIGPARTSDGGRRTGHCAGPFALDAPPRRRSPDYVALDTLRVRLQSSEFPCDHIQINRVTGREAISQLFSFAIELVCLDPDEFNPDDAAGALASLVFEQDGEELRTIHGMIAEVDDLLSAEVEFRAYRLLLVPRAHRLTLVDVQEVFLDTSIPDIVKQKLDLVGLGATDVEMRLTGAYPPRDFVVEYRETDLAFVSRITEHLGIGFFFTHEDGDDKIVFTDHPGGYRPVAERERAVFRSRGEQHDVYRLERKTRVMPRTWMVQDYNHRSPRLDLAASYETAAGLAGGVVEYGPHVKTPAEGRALAQIRAEEREAQSYFYSGESDVCTFAAGAQVTLEGHPRLSEKRLLLTEVEHSYAQVTMTHGGTGGEHVYRNTFRAVDGEKPYRPPRLTPKPRIHGVLSGVVEPKPGGDIDAHADIDGDGSYSVRFHFDASPPGGRPRASHPIRMSQPLAGPSYGIHFPLRTGVEVLVTFVDGDPDRPIIQGAMPHPVSPSPVTRTNALQSRIQTQSGIAIVMKDT